MSNPTIKLLVAAFLAVSLMLPRIPVALAQDDTSVASDPTQTTVVSSPEQPLAFNSGQWTEIQPGEWQWYAFKYDFDDGSTNRSDDEDSDDGDENSNDNRRSKQSSAFLRLDANPADGVSLLLLNGEQVRAWQHGQKLEGFGAATPATDRTLQKAKVGEFCKNYPDDPICTGGSRAGTMCENLRDPARVANECRYATHESRGYANWSGVIGASGTYYIVVRGNPRLSGPLQYKFTFTGDGVSMK